MHLREEEPVHLYVFLMLLLRLFLLCLIVCFVLFWFIFVFSYCIVLYSYPLNDKGRDSDVREGGKTFIDIERGETIFRI